MNENIKCITTKEGVQFKIFEEGTDNETSICYKINELITRVNVLTEKVNRLQNNGSPAEHRKWCK